MSFTLLFSASAGALLRPGVGRRGCLTVLADRFAQADERPQSAAREAGEEPVEQLVDRVDGEAWGEDRSDHLLHRPGTRELPAASADRGEGAGLTVGEVVGVLEQRPAVLLELLGGVGLAGVAQLVPVLAADLVQCLGRELYDVVVVDHDRRLRACRGRSWRSRRSCPSRPLAGRRRARRSRARSRCRPSATRPGCRDRPGQSGRDRTEP